MRSPRNARKPSSDAPSCAAASRRMKFFIVSVATTLELSPSV